MEKSMIQSLKPSTTSGQHYYNHLTVGQQKVYNAMLRGIKAFSKKIEMPIMPVNEISLVFNSIMLDNPMVFYVDSFSYMKDLYKKKCIIMPEYKYKKSEAKAKMNAVMNSLRVFDAVQGKSDYEKELFVHDYCLNNIKYDFSGNAEAHTVLGPVLNKAAVCEGIAKYVKLALDYLGVRCLVVSGRAKSPEDDDEMEAHAWNIVEVSGKPYHLDVTFDLSLTDKQNRYDYFNLSDECIKKDHTISSTMPVCTTSGMDYYSINSLSVNSPSEYERLLEKRLKQGDKSIVVKLQNTQFSDKVKSKLMNIAKQQYSSNGKRSSAIEIRCNTSQMVFEINFR
jgi:hypothetical protein